MAYVFIQLLINLILLWYGIDGIVINCTVEPIILQPIPNQIMGTIAVANMSNEEVYWDYVNFEIGEQFPLNFLVVITKNEINSAFYILQLHIYKLPRNHYDLPLWSADSIDYLTRTNKPNNVKFIANSDHEPIGPCLMGIIVNTQEPSMSISSNQLRVKVGTMPTITLPIHVKFFPILFMITNISVSQIGNSTLVTVLLTKPSTSIAAYEARERAVFSVDNKCTTMLFKVAEEKSVDLTITMSAHVFTSISLLALGLTYTVYRNDNLIFEKTELIENLQFPVITQKTLVSITRATNYTIVATIFGPISGYSSGGTLFEGVTSTRLVPGTNNNVKISMLYTGPKIGTTIIGTVRQTPPNQNTWPLAGTNLAFVIADQNSGLSESDQFVIFDQTFPIQFTLLAVKAINQSYQNVAFTVTITYRDGTVLWASTTENNRIIFGQLNKLDINLTMAAGNTCRAPGQGWCDSSSSDINAICCSQFKCSGECKLP